ncbi:MAG: PspC domain-containing protein [Putridiphycobacter sp.]|nr:PspC domain-containing protein [Putridiphycobacter sp.]
MATIIQRRCTNCGTWNGDVDHCENCNNPISIKEIERIEHIKKEEIAAQQPKEKLEIFIDKYKQHPFFMVRLIFFILNSIFMVFMGIGSLIAYFIAWTAG